MNDPCPCNGCKDRCPWPNCHATCVDRYIPWQKRREKKLEEARKRKQEEDMMIGYGIKSFDRMKRSNKLHK